MVIRNMSTICDTLISFLTAGAIKYRKQKMTNDDISMYMESLMLGIVPSVVYLQGQLNGGTLLSNHKLAQALDEFVVFQRVELSGLTLLPQFNKCKWDDLPRDIQRQVKETIVTISCFEDELPKLLKQLWKSTR